MLPTLIEDFEVPWLFGAHFRGKRLRRGRRSVFWRSIKFGFL